MKSKVTGGMATLALIALVVFGVSLVDPRARTGDEQLIAFTGIWTPSPRNFDGVHMTIKVGPKLMVDKIFTTAPVNRGYPAKKGQRVEIRLELIGNGVTGFLGCSIAVGNFEAVNDHKEGPLSAHTSLTCWTVV